MDQSRPPYAAAAFDRDRTKPSDTIMLVDGFLPEYEVSDAVASAVDADLATTWDAST